MRHRAIFDDQVQGLTLGGNKRSVSSMRDQAEHIAAHGITTTLCGLMMRRRALQKLAPLEKP